VPGVLCSICINAGVTASAPETSEAATTTGGTGERKLGDVDGNDRITINDALEILKFLAKLDSEIHQINNPHAFNAARINTPGEGLPTINDALEILKHLAKLDSKLRVIWG
jgi:hypothetical protein